jgi:DNA repair protein RadC
MAHSHVSANVEPSDFDIRETRKLCRAGKILGIPM